MSDRDVPPQITALRIQSMDFWRGAYLLMIYINHIPDSLLSIITFRNWGFADSAEAFVFISGYSAMLAFGRYFEHGGMVSGFARTIKRAWQLFCAHILLVFALAATIVLAGNFTDSKPLMQELNFSPFFIETEVAIVKLLHLQYMPNLTDILPLYIVFILMFPLAWYFINKSPLLGLFVSLCAWGWVHISGATVANYPDGITWFFNPIAWQLLFVSGMASYKARDHFKHVIKSNLLFVVSITILIASIIAIAPWARYEGLASFRIIPAEFLSIDEKTNLSCIRIIHFAALAFVAVRLFPESSSIWKNRIIKLISLCGRHSLAVYCTGSLLSLVVTFILHIYRPNIIGNIMITFTGVIFLIALSKLLQSSSELLRRSKNFSDQQNTKTLAQPIMRGAPD